MALLGCEDSRKFCSETYFVRGSNEPENLNALEDGTFTSLKYAQSPTGFEP